MEGNFSSGNMMQGNTSFVDFDLRGPIGLNHNQQHAVGPHRGEGSSVVHPTIHGNFPLTIGRTQDISKTISRSEYGKGERGKSTSDEDEQTVEENDQSKGKKTSLWQRVKWTDEMVRLLITSVSYINEETEDGSRRKSTNLQKKGKWKLVSKVMAQRGHFVSPQQCEDKFNDLNKRYKRLNEILGRGTSCEVVENPTLLDLMDHISAKAKDEVRKILSSKHLHYEEMCSYHNKNRLHLPPDPELQRALRIALRSRDDNEDDNGGDVDSEMDGRDEPDENENENENQNPILYKRLKQSQETVDARPAYEGVKENVFNEQWMSHRSVQLEEKRLHIEAQMLELENERFKWQRFCRKKDRELEAMRLENEKMKLDNERLALELRQKEIGLDNR